MPSTDLLRSEVTHYQILADQLKTYYRDIDDETLQDTLEGISSLPELIQGLIRSSLEDEVFVTALKARLDDMQARLSRFKARFDKKRELACWAMANADIGKIQAEDFSLSLRQGPPRLEIIDEARIPEEFIVPQPPRLDRAGLLSALKRGDSIPGTFLVSGDLHISVRVK